MEIVIPAPAHASVFVDEYGHLCVMRPDGQILYAVLSTTPPHAGTAPTAPSYERLDAVLPPERPQPPIPEAKIPTFWEHLTDTKASV